MKKLELFDKISDFRIASYPIQDLKVLHDGFVVQMEDAWLNRFGYEYGEYQEWLHESGDIENPNEEIQVNIKHANGELIAKLPPNVYSIG